MEIRSSSSFFRTTPFIYRQIKIGILWSRFFVDYVISGLQNAGQFPVEIEIGFADDLECDASFENLVGIVG
jgi:hypothetical protein